MKVRKAIATLVIGILATGRLASAQSPGSLRESHDFETRSELESRAATAETNGQSAEARMIRYRLEQGDFQDGDRIVVRVEGAGGFADTLIVRSGKTLDLPQMEDLLLDGVLRSELLPKLTVHIGRYLRNPVIKANPLVRVGVLGSIVRPGYYYVSADLPLSDVLMAASGPTPEADPGKISVRRGGVVVIDEKNTRTAINRGASIDMLHMRAGDEISVGKQRHLNWGVIAPTVTGILALLVAVIR